MEIAKNLLQHHNEKPSEIYYKVGYENHSSFTQTFKQTFGLTPKEFQLKELNLHP
jgi:YesN/AraC family two-component response regulator